MLKQQKTVELIHLVSQICVCKRTPCNTKTEIIVFSLKAKYLVDQTECTKLILGSTLYAPHFRKDFVMTVSRIEDAFFQQS